MKSKQMNRLTRDPRAYMRYKTTGKLPELIRPDSPLIRLLEKIPPMYRSCFVGISLGPDLGYNRSLRFNDANQLLRWIKPANEVFADRAGLGPSACIQNFQRPIRREDFEFACAGIQAPGHEILDRIFGKKPAPQAPDEDSPEEQDPSP